LSRPELNSIAPGETARDLAEPLAPAGAQPATGKAGRREAIARFLGNAPDWREARDSCGGAFAAAPGSQR
jgi:hypothetical protein